MRRAWLTAAAGVLLLPACSGADAALVEDLESSDVTLYRPEVRGVAPSAVGVPDGQVRLSYDDDGYRYSVDLVPGDGRALCDAVSYEDGSSCSEADGVMTASFEEMAVVAVERSGTVLVARGIVTEADPDLATDVGRALQGAPEVSAEELAESVA